MEPLRPTRRTLTRTAAWTVPVVAVATAAPAFAASGCDCAGFSVQNFPSTAGTSGNGWTMEVASGASTVGGTDQFTGGTFVTVADPPSGQTRVVRAYRTICITAGRWYTFSYNYDAYLANPRPMTSVLQINNTTITGSLIDTDQLINLTRTGSRTFRWRATLTGNAILAFVHTVSADSNSTTGDDITLSNFTASCGVI